MVEQAQTTPLQRLQALSPVKEAAFLALFAGARSYITIFRHKGGTVKPPHWGKAECEWVDDWEDFYFRELVDLGLMKPKKERTFSALGLGDGTDWTGEEWEMLLTDEGFSACEAWWADWKDQVDAQEKSRG